MKIMKYIVPALLGGMLTLQSCEHFLDTKPTETYSEELVWGSRSTADAFVLRTNPDILAHCHHAFAKARLHCAQRLRAPA